MFVVISISSAVSVQGDTCNTCNCQFNNVEVLSQLIESKIATARINESGKLGLSVTYHKLIQHIDIIIEL